MRGFRTLVFVLTFFASSVFPSSIEIGVVRKFPKRFRFGVATAAYQIEGAWNTSGKGENIWDRFVHTKPRAIADSSTADVACDSYHEYRRDVQTLRELGVDYYRFSLSWSRLLPTGFSDSISEDGVTYYNSLIDELRAKGIEPLVTLYHWDLPQPLQDLGGWPNPLLAEYFEDYARVAFRTFGDRVKMWLTFNEPRDFCLEGYGGAGAAPALDSPGIADYMCAHTVLLAHARAYHLYDREFRPGQGGNHKAVTSGSTLDGYWSEPASSSRGDVQAAERSLQFNFGWFAHPIFSAAGDYPLVMRARVAARSARQGFPRSRLPAFSPLEARQLIGSADFLGLNHYSTRLARARPAGSAADAPSFADDCGVEEFFDSTWPGSASTWLKVVPWGFRKILNWIRSEYQNTPVIITENGFSTRGLQLRDPGRVSYLSLYLNALLDALEDGCQVLAYTAWTLMDNFEWTSGYTERFGLYEVDFTSPNRTRTIRDSGKMFAEVIRTRSITSFMDCPGCDEDVQPFYNINAIIV